MTGNKRWLRLVVNGKCASDDRLRDAVAGAREEGHRVEVRVTWESGDADRYAREAADDGVETVVAGGGDGTINEIVCALAGLDSRPALGIVPLGTANDFATSAEIPLDPSRSLGLVLDEEPVEMDFARAGDRAFLNVATGGFGTRITSETSDELKRILGGAAYFVTGLTLLGELAPDEATLRGPDLSWSGAFSVLAIGNGRQAGGGQVLCPDALADDGLLDVRLFPSIPKEERREALQEILSEGLEALEARIVEARVPWLEVDSREAIQLNLDGEPVTSSHFRIEVVPRGLRVHLPKSVAILGGNGHDPR